MTNKPALEVESEFYLTIGPFLIHHTWEKDSLGDGLPMIIKHFANFITPPNQIDARQFIHEIPLHLKNAPPPGINAQSVMSIENDLRRWSARKARENGGFLCHAAGVLANGKGWLLPGRSGAGKTTLALKLASCTELVLSDEVCIVLPVGGSYKLWGTPFYGTGKQGVTGPGCPLQAIIFPHRSRSMTIEPINWQEGLPLMLQAVVVPDKTDPKVLDEAISLVKCCRLFQTEFALNTTPKDVYESIITALSR